ncbi:HEPN-associated N-terminal domain-containing protein [Streptomyces sp. NPDC127097]|uniref:HEPN-associated N-terminal domain-containing protein n=1 Tax=Streptomyces sp. NPDC127097 TaxID=3347136 RepID=UPI003668FBAF
MGYWKNRAIQIEEQGWAPTDDVWVCEQCVNEPFLAAIVKDAAREGEECSYCGESPAAELDIFVDAFTQGVFARYGDAEGTLPYDSEDGVYIGYTLDTDEMVGEYCHIFREPLFQEAVVDAINDKIWTDLHSWYTSPSEAISTGWERFREAVMYESRYVFWQRKDWQDQEYDADGVHPARIMQSLSEHIDEHNLYRTVEVSDTFWRARTRTETEASWGAKDLGTAGREHAKQANRMSPAGIPMFYGAEDADTAVRESLVRTSDTHVSVAAFRGTQRFTVVDLTGSRLPEPPSEFDVERLTERYGILFLKDFTKDLTREVRPTFEQIEYVPTQILMEYLLKVHHPKGGGSVDGLIYTSAVTGKTCVVLDVPNKRCIDRDDEIERFADDKLHLKIDPASLSTFRIKREYEPLPPADNDPFA